MAKLQVNTPGMAATDNGYISSITIRSGVADSVLTPNATTGQVTTGELAATKLVQDHSTFRLISG